MKKILVTISVFILLLMGAYILLPGKVLQFFVWMERTASGLEEKRVVVEGQTWVYLEGGEGVPLVLVHGFGADKDNWTRVARHLTPHYRVIIPDLLGFGESDKPTDRSYSVGQQAAQLRGFVHAMGPKRVHLGGNSMGGAISLYYAGTWADEVQSVWLLAPSGINTEARSELDRVIAAGQDNPLVVESPADQRDLINFVMSNPPPVPEQLVREIGKRAVANRAMNEKVFADLQIDLWQDVLPKASTISAPALIVWGEEDRLLHPDGAAVLDRRIPTSRVIMMADTGHMPMIEYPQRTAGDYLAFRSELVSP